MEAAKLEILQSRVEQLSKDLKAANIPHAFATIFDDVDAVGYVPELWQAAEMRREIGGLWK